VTHPEQRLAVVTGASGFIGHHVCSILLERGYRVRALLAPSDPAPNLQGLPVELAVADICDLRTLTAAMAGADTIFHLAAIYALWLPEPARMFAVNVQGALNVVEAAHAVSARRLVHTSSIAAVGTEPNGTPATERTLFNRWGEANDYIVSKYVSELEVCRRARTLGVDTVIVNPAFPFGAGDVGPTPTGAMIQLLLEGKFPVVFDGGTNAVDVRDVAMGHVLAAERGRSFESYLLAGHNLTVDAFVERVCALGNVPKPRIRLPREALLAVGALGDVWAKAAGKAPPFTVASNAYIAGRYLYFDITKAKTELGYTIRPLDETLREAIAWFRGR
jgi:dihydroflavonol-4-reductase